MRSISLLLFLIPMGMFSQSQQQKSILGSIQNENIPVQDAVITNPTKGEASRSNSEGMFKIKVSEGDTLTFTHISFGTFSENVSRELMDLDLVHIQVSDKVNRLDEVEVNAFPNINAVSLGILEHQPEQLTTSQRRLNTAGDFKPIQLLAILGGSLPVDPIINKISGRTKKLKKLVKFDEDENYFDFIVDNHSEFIKSELNISDEEFNRFVYELIDHAEIKKSIQTKNSSQLQFLIQDLVVQFRKNQANQRLENN